jgi:lipopolysaccharide transport system ATP-binding protein
VTDPAVAVHDLAKRYRIGHAEGRLPRIMPTGRWARVQRRRPAKRERDIWALRGVSFQVEPGEILGVIGPNGAGKTTLLKLLGRITPPTRGRAELRGRVLPLLELGAGFQPHYTGRQNILLNSVIHGIPHGEVLERMDEIVKFSGVGTAIDRAVSKYSSGMYLRLAFSVAIHLRPDVLLADEVLAVGDIEFQELALRRVEAAGREGMAVLFVSHDMAQVRRVCDRVLWLHQGEIVAEGDPDTVVSEYETSAHSRVASAEVRDRESDMGSLEQVRLLSAEGSEIGAVRVSEEACIELAFRTSKPDTLVRGGVLLLSGGTRVFTSVQQEVFTAAQPGLHRATVRIPPLLLSDTDYQVTASLGFWRNGRTSLLIKDKVLGFRAYEDHQPDAVRGSYDGRFFGVLRPLLRWHVRADDGERSQ